MIVYVTKWALTRGIVEVEVEEPTPAALGMVVDTSNPAGHLYYHKGQWHRNRNDALDAAWVMRDKRLASLERSIRKLEAMDLG